MTGAAATAGAQRIDVSGTVRLGVAPPADGRLLPGVWAVLHHVSMGGGSPLDSMRTDARGGYHFTLTQPDTSAVYLVSVSYDGIAYFSLPARLADKAVRLDPVMVYPASPRGPAPALRQRLLTVARAKSDGTRDVLEIVRLENTGTTTRISADTATPTWAGRLPPGAVHFQVGEGDVSPQAVAQRHDSVLVFAPLPPHDPRQLTYSYTFAAGTARLTVPIDQATDELDLLIEDTTAVVSGVKLDTLPVEPIENRSFARYLARTVARGTTLAVELPRGPFRPQQLVPVIVAVLVVALAAGMWVALRRRA